MIYPNTIKSDDKLPAGGWTLTSNDPTNVTFVEKDKFVSNDVQALVDAGYWLDGYNGISTLTSTTTGDVLVYVVLGGGVAGGGRGGAREVGSGGRGVCGGGGFTDVTGRK